MQDSPASRFICINIPNDLTLTFTPSLYECFSVFGTISCTKLLTIAIDNYIAHFNMRASPHVDCGGNGGISDAQKWEIVDSVR